MTRRNAGEMVCLARARGGPPWRVSRARSICWLRAPSTAPARSCIAPGGAVARVPPRRAVFPASIAGCNRRCARYIERSSHGRGGHARPSAARTGASTFFGIGGGPLSREPRQRLVRSHPVASLCTQRSFIGQPHACETNTADFEPLSAPEAPLSTPIASDSVAKLKRFASGQCVPRSHRDRRGALKWPRFTRQAVNANRLSRANRS
jgi:hypothetical protein